MSKEGTRYVAKPIKSNSVEYNYTSIVVVAEEIKEGYIVLWQHHGVFVGEVKNKKVSWLYDSKKNKQVYSEEEIKKDNIVRIRAFTETKEIHIWRSGNELKGRLRTDDAGKEMEYIETDMKLRSVIAHPLKNNEKFNSEDIFLRTRNYIGYTDDIRQAGYVDSRFVEFAIKNSDNEKRKTN
ncbi:MAG: hypothetical protein LC128_10255 [Chitinophagales bacterium]|nr:hypothetical protein [Chitinophagales bacterium]